MSELPRIKKFRITYSKANDHKTIYADGALVGQPAGAAIIMDFYVGNFLPDAENFVWSEKNKNYDTTLDTPDVHPYERVRQVEIVMTPENAETLAKGILERVSAVRGDKK